METVCHDKHWDVALACDDGGNIIAALPYLIGSKLGLRYILQPQLTQYNGPWYRPGTDHDTADSCLIGQLHRNHPILFDQNFAPDITPGPAWHRCRITPRITYRLEDISDPQRIFDGFDRSRRQRQIRRAERQLQPATIDAGQFATFHRQYWESRGEHDLLPHDFMVRLITTACQRGQGLLLGLQDSGGTLKAARFVAYDSHSAYALLSALDPQGHPNGASALLFWLIIQQLEGHTRAFDFEGSMQPSIAQSYALYGATPTTYYKVQKLFL